MREIFPISDMCGVSLTSGPEVSGSSEDSGKMTSSVTDLVFVSSAECNISSEPSALSHHAFLSLSSNHNISSWVVGVNAVMIFFIA